ncbi:unnamed protein product [Dracunculus medinensis]|uniref:Restriction endonuclease n=1 Tax=Dracunculus medinensis TaxID=318479 RepID=A0A0N4UDH6_DRAME|nr:unnamed protein product [Dracunculus medinensis]
MRSISHICDPNEVLSESDRYRLNNILVRMNGGSTGSINFCASKGLDATLIIVKQGTKQFADQLRNNWKLDEQCKKSALFLLSSNDRKFYFSSDANSVISENDFFTILSANQKQLDEGQFTSALLNIFKQIQENIAEANRGK